MSRSLLPLAALLLCSLSSHGAPEPWADPKLTVRDGLELWLDASRAAGDKPAVEGPLAAWLDASGRARNLTSPSDEARPKLVKVGDRALVRFDGLKNHLRATKVGVGLKSFTVVAVVVPRQNLGAFQGFLAFNEKDRRDYESGLNLDYGPGPSLSFSTFNVEGRGFGGARNLRTGDSPFGQLKTVEVASDADAKTLAVTIDGKPEGQRPREPGVVSMEEITLGSRFYNNGTGPQIANGFARCDVVELLVYDRALKPEEAKQVRDYLSTKYAALKDLLPPEPSGAGEVLIPVKEPPAAQVFLPGFTVRELPLDLTNVNNVKYRADGTLAALGYDGRVWLLRDTDGDGLEDKADLFWENKGGGLRAPIGMDLTPPDYPKGDGLFVVGKTKLVLIVDTDRDGKADQEIEVAGGWKESFHQVDGLGVAFDPRDGSVYYGRGTYNFADPFLKDKEGKPHYSIKDESSTIVRVAPDFKSREIIATGIRFPVGIRLNRAGDLFVTDQEGATWVPNGNPFDELLHIQKGRHYGFPARHPKFLPDVIDEPSTYDYGPQHQSTCGFNFNEPVKKDGPTFGPKEWAGDALVTGYSRGKLYRTSLVKTESGYTAKSQLLACLNMLTVDCCVAPDGSLVVACHSGGPDWGSGPTGKGKLYKISYTDPNHPQPLFAWPNGQREVRVEFDRPVEGELLRDVLKQAKLTAGKYVRAGDRFESLFPGYAVVQMQKVTPRFNVAIRSAQLTADRRTLVLATDPLPAAVHYALQLPGMGRPSPAQTPKGTLPQHAAIDLDFDLSGCDVTWKSKDGKTEWKGWLPSLDLDVSRKFTVGSAHHDLLWAAMKEQGELTFATQLDLTDMLRPAVQPGSKIDYEFPPEEVNVEYVTTGRAEFARSSETGSGFESGGGTQRGHVNYQPKREETIPFRVTLKDSTTFGGQKFSLSWSTAEDKRHRPMPLHRMLVPWADVKAEMGKPVVAVRIPEIEGGSWARGRKVFFGEQAACSKCHAVSGQGGDIGPDLTNLTHRDYASVMRDIASPSFAINPDHLTYVVTLGDGRSLTGVVRTAGNKLKVFDAKAVVTEVDKEDVESMKASKLSTMPEDLPKILGPEKMKDLLTYLLTPAPSMPRDYAGPRPKPRPLAEVTAVLKGAPTPPEKIRPLRVVLVAGVKDHGPGEHDYPAWLKMWSELMSIAEQVEVVKANEWPAKEEFQKADVMVFYQHGDWNAKRATEIDAFLERGGGLVYVHWAVDGRKEAPEFAKRIGLAGAGAVGFRHGEVTLSLSGESKHPVMRNFGKLKLVDETYWKMVGDLPEDRVLGTAVEEGQPRPQLWSLERGRGRVFVSIPGHYSWTFDDPLFRVLLLRAIAWTGKEPVDRFNDLVLPGAEVEK